MTSLFLSMPSPSKFCQVIQVILQMRSCDQSLVTLVFLWEKLSQPSFYKDLTRKTFEWWFWFKSNNLGLSLGTNLIFYTSVAKGSIPTFVIPSFDVLGANSDVCRTYRGKTGKECGKPFCKPPSPILDRVKRNHMVLAFINQSFKLRF